MRGTWVFIAKALPTRSANPLWSILIVPPGTLTGGRLAFFGPRALRR
jgi:hypothetical protein